MANKPGNSINHTSQERSRFQINAIKVTIPAVTPSVMVRKPEKWINSLVTETNSAAKRSASPTAHHPSLVRGIPRKGFNVVFTHVSGVNALALQQGNRQ